MPRRLVRTPENMDSTDLCGDEPIYITFECSECGKQIRIPTEHYDGRWDHPPNEPVCAECRGEGP